MKRPPRRLRTGPLPVPFDDGTVLILQGRDGFVAYCRPCGQRVTPDWWPRATVAAALTDRDKHKQLHLGYLGTA
jgi:hypothetical protein